MLSVKRMKRDQVEIHKRRNTEGRDAPEPGDD